VIVIPFFLYAIALGVMKKENSFTFAPTILDRPIGFDDQRIFWSLIPTILNWGTAIWVFFLLPPGWRFAVPILMIATYYYLNRLFAKQAIMRAMEAMYPSFLEGIMKAQNGRDLTEEERQEKVGFAKVIALETLWRNSMHREPDRRILAALLKTVGLKNLISTYCTIDDLDDPPS
jgi:hypothetical protein